MRSLCAGPFDVLIPETRPERMRGLRGRRPDAGRAMLIERCRSIHTFGMPDPILVAWLDQRYRVIAVARVAPRRFELNLRARHVFECAVDADVRVGDEIQLPRVRPGS